jgi:MFS family permease
MPFPASFAGIIAMASGLMFVSSIVFVSMGEPTETAQPTSQTSFFDYLRQGIAVFHDDRRFRLYVFAQWFGGAVLMAMPFYVVQATILDFDLGRVALLLGAQTTGALVSNALWGWWGDRLGKASLLQAIAIGRILPPLLILSLVWTSGSDARDLMPAFLGLFFILGALANGLTIAGIGFLMEISPEDRRPAYSGYFNALTAPAFLFPLLGGAIATWGGLPLVFALSLIAAAAQSVCIWVLRAGPAR